MTCGVPTDGPRCPAHRLPQKPANRAYASPAYRAYRTELLGRAALCEVPGCLRMADTLDHIVPLAKGGTHEPSNLRPLCRHHNSQKGAC